MKKHFALVLCCFAGFMFLTSCNNNPEKKFDVAVLNSNMLVGFANNGLDRELESPSAKMGKTKDEILTMQRGEVIDAKIKFVEDNYEKLKEFSQDDDAKDIVQKSLSLHELILPVYKNEYTQLAKLYDSNAPKEEIEKLRQSIHDQYFPKFETLYKELIASGKVYAKAHKIDVHWGQ
ncbi:MAG: hypothetical protein EOO10_07230 [Chitinophagaceae bacterium]|nr:MAG: hypothetical protein EOO10_07230 [Chitinophagaceae bacterium]